MTEIRRAKFSRCGKYRYHLRRVWDKSKPIVMFICLNPSTADGLEDDPTVNRMRGFAKSWGYGGFYVCNLFAYASTDFMPLTTMEDPVGPENDKYLSRIARRCEKVVFAWGVNGKTQKRHLEVISMFPMAFCIEITKEGFPNHPLYLKADLKLKPYTYGKSR